MELNSFLYIDPGAGSYLVQALVAAALGIAFFFKNIKIFFINAWLHIKSFFTRTQKHNNDK
jgi:hypothetical protein